MLRSLVGSEMCIRDSMNTLVDYTINRHYPEIKSSNSKALDLLNLVMEKQCQLVINWMRVGFIHGVMNTDNMAISGETIDYGPCAFMEAYDPDTVFSSIDRHGRYKYSNQPKIGLWNLSCLAGCLLPIMDGDDNEKEEVIRESLENFSKDVNSRINIEMTKKIALRETKESNELTKSLLSIMHQNGADFTLTFRSLSSAIKGNDDHFLKCFDNDEEPKDWLQKWKKLLKKEKGNIDENLVENLNSINPIYIPRNHMIERAIREYMENNTHKIMDELLEVTANPFLDQKNKEDYVLPAKEDEQVTQTFCGT